MAYAEYPKMMRHPAHRAAVLSKDIINRDGTVTKAPSGQPEKFPDVYVNNEDQEKQYASLGYAPNGTSDPEAYRRAMAAEPPSGHQHRDYPRWLYRLDDSGDMEVELDHEVYTLKAVVVDSEKHHQKLGAGWHMSPAAAIEAGPLVDETKQQAERSPRGRGRQDTERAAN